MSYLLIIIVVAFVLGPIMWIMPSPRQRKQLELRAYAVQKGLQIKIADLPQSHRQRVRKEDRQQGVLYRLPLVMTRPALNHSQYLLQQGDGEPEWSGPDSVAIKALLGEDLLKAIDGVVALECNQADVGVYWREKGGVEAVEAIYQLLNELREGVMQTEEFSHV